jgi:hypothetical protein
VKDELRDEFLDTLQKRLQGDAAAVEKGNRIAIQQVEALTERREGLKRATELFESEHAAIAELLQAGQPNRLGILRMGATPAPQSPAASTTTAAVRGQLGHSTRIGRTKTNAKPATPIARRSNGLTRVAMIAAVLKRHPAGPSRELIANLLRRCGVDGNPAET